MHHYGAYAYDRTRSYAYALLGALGLLPLLVATGGEACRLCKPEDASTVAAAISEIPISIDIVTQLDFSRAALSGANGGAIEVNPDNGDRYGSICQRRSG